MDRFRFLAITKRTHHDFKDLHVNEDRGPKKEERPPLLHGHWSDFQYRLGHWNIQRKNVDALGGYHAKD